MHATLPWTGAWGNLAPNLKCTAAHDFAWERSRKMMQYITTMLKLPLLKVIAGASLLALAVISMTGAEFRNCLQDLARSRARSI